VSGTGINWVGVVFWVILAVFVACIIFYVSDWFHFRTLISQLTSQIGIPKIGTLNFSGVIDFLTKNSLGIGAITTLGTAAITLFVKNYQTNKQLDMAIQKANDAQINATQASATKFAELQKKIDMYESDTTADELQKKITALSGCDQIWEAKYAEAQKTIQALQLQLDQRPVIETTRIG
jgi:hypothetical protein